ncbi:MAG: glycosyltransferase [Cyanobacteria bacterium SZAS-4]|nr:glycosyltransferase [Cyanobacteria bacterium SZAS-4]
MSAAPDTRRILFISLEHWDNVWRRNQIVCANLLERCPDAEILWVGPPTDLWNLQGLSSIDVMPGKLFKPAKTTDRLHALKPFKPLPNKLGRAWNETLFKSCLADALKKLGWQNYVTWVNNQSYCHLLPLDKSTKLIYDITDDWSQASVPPHILSQIKADDEWMLTNADEVIVCSVDLYENKRGQCKSIHLIRNGVKLQPYLPESLATNKVPEEMKFSGPVAGYIGTLHEDRLDVDLVVEVASKLPHVHFVFIGPNSLSATNTKTLEDLPNCHILGARPYEQLPSYMAGFNVCITPHVVSPFTESLDPIKMYEYMATGKPIVSTACAGFRDLEQLIFMAKDKTQFAQFVEKAIAEGNERATPRIEWAREQTWDKRVDAVETLLGWKS